MCGILGIYSSVNVNYKLFYGLTTLQHRGQESCGMSISDGTNIVTKKGMGLVQDVFHEKDMDGFFGTSGIGHVRYSTAGGRHDFNTQPFTGFTKGKQIAIAHNGNLINYHILRTRLEEDGMMFQSTSDTEVILYLICRYYKGDIVEAIKEAAKRIEGAYSFVLMMEDKIIAVRDPNGFRPLVIGRTATGTIVASENSAIEVLGGEFDRDIAPGEIVVIDQDGETTSLLDRRDRQTFCVFEHVYFARNDATLDGINTYHFRRRSGELLYSECPVEADLVIPVPDSGFPAAIGFSHKSGIPLAEGLVKNRYMGRTFIKPTQEAREIAVKLKLNPLAQVVEGKRIVLVDDSIVRGTTSINLIQNLRRAGAKEVHMRITSPPVKYSCYYGIDTPNRKSLIAATMDMEQIQETLGTDSLGFLSKEGLEKASKSMSGFCFACFNGEYPIDPCII